MVSGVAAATHCGDEVYFSVGMEVSLRDQRYINAGFSGVPLP